MIQSDGTQKATYTYLYKTRPKSTNCNFTIINVYNFMQNLKNNI